MTVAPRLGPDPRCDRVVDLLTDYLDGALEPVDRVALESHLAECDGCAAVLAQLRATVALVGRLRDHDLEALDARARETLLAAFRTWAAGRLHP